MAERDTMEEVLTEIGFGRWQGLAMVVALFSQAIVMVQHSGSTFLSAPVSFRCSYPGYIQAANSTNITRSGYHTELSDENTDEFPSKCLAKFSLIDSEDIPKTKLYKFNQTRKFTGLPSCPEIEYDTSTFQSTVVTEWNLVCEKSTLRPLYQMAYSIGAILGSTFCGHLSDWLGRKRTLQIGNLLILATVVCISIVPWYGVMICLRILVGTGSALTIFPVFTLIPEISPLNRRTIAGMVPGLSYFLFMGVFSWLAYLVPDWRKLLLLSNSLLLIQVPLCFIIDESPRWLIQTGRPAEAVRILRKVATQHGVTFSSSTSLTLEHLSQMSKDTVLEKIREGEKKVEAHSNKGFLWMLRACFLSPGMRTILILMPILWFLKRSLYIGIILNANNFSGNSPFKYVAILGAMGVLSLILSIPISLKITRRIFLGGSLSITGALLLLELAVPPDYWLVKWIMVMTSFCFISGAFQVSYVFTAEVFPTVFRTRGFTFTNFVGSIGEMSIPLVTDIVVQSQWWAANVTFGCAGILASILLPFFPETKDRPMPETFQDVEDRYWNKFKGHQSDIIDSKETRKGNA